ncbi:MAG: hypothetical protein IJN82_03485 [Clostridia bacterium]|nr:hypothetical protein [Clostridia bacterium]
MLSKLLKYDFKALFKYWWIAAVSSLGLSILGGCGLMLMNAEMELPQVVSMTVISALMLVVLSFPVFTVLSLVLVMVRFCKNFYSDEGYLTFTLPVKRAQLLNSKLISGSLLTLITYLALGINLFILLFCGVGASDLFEAVGKLFMNISRAMEGYCVAFWLELILLFLAWTVFSLLLPFCCVSLAAMMTQKARIITAIGLYYGANTVISFVMQLFFFFGLSSLMGWLYAMPDGMIQPTVVLILLGAIRFVVAVSAVLYLIQYWMLDRKLNLT